MQNINENSQISAPEPAAPAEMIDPKAARKEAINDMKRVHIMDAAMKVIARDGYMNARLDDIAEEAGFSKASIYHYFPDKEALFINIIIREQRSTLEDCEKIVARGLPFVETLREFSFTFYDRFFGSSKFYGADHTGLAPSTTMMSSLFVSMTKHEELLTASIGCKNETFGLLTRVIEKAKRDGVLTLPVDDQTICIFITSFFQSFMMENLHNARLKGTPGVLPSRADFGKAMESMFTFLSPWIKEEKDA